MAGDVTVGQPSFSILRSLPSFCAACGVIAWDRRGALPLVSTRPSGPTARAAGPLGPGWLFHEDHCREWQNDPGSRSPHRKSARSGAGRPRVPLLRTCVPFIQPERKRAPGSAGAAAKMLIPRTESDGRSPGSQTSISRSAWPTIGGPPARRRAGEAAEPLWSRGCPSGIAVVQFPGFTRFPFRSRYGNLRTLEGAGRRHASEGYREGYRGTAARGSGFHEDGDATLCFVQGEVRAAQIAIAAADGRRAQNTSSEGRRRHAFGGAARRSHVARLRWAGRRRSRRAGPLPLWPRPGPGRSEPSRVLFLLPHLLRERLRPGRGPPSRHFSSTRPRPWARSPATGGTAGMKVFGRLVVAGAVLTALVAVASATVAAAGLALALGTASVAGRR
jgi:hypothetical protein